MLFGGDSGSPTFVRNFNPFSSSKRIGINFIYEPLEVVNSLNGDATPFLATGDTIKDAKTVVYNIRQGVKWSDGKDFTAADVVYTFNLMKKYPALDTLGVWQHIASIDSTADTVTFHLKQADVPAVTILDQQVIVPQHIWESIKDPVKDTVSNPIGTGPYVLSQFSPNQYTLKKNPSYWQAGKVAVDNIVFPASNTQQDIVSKGYDWAYSFITDVDKTWVGANSKNTYWFPAGGVVSLFPNLTKAPFNDVNFRQGLSYALDRTTIADQAELGYVKGASQLGLLLPNMQSWVNSSIPDSGNITQSDTKALSYFKNAGYTQQGGKLVDSTGKQLTLTITVPNGYTDWLRGVQEVQKELQKLGIAVKISQPQQAQYTQQQNTGDFDLIVSSFGGTGSIYQDMNNLLSSQFYQPVGTAASANFERYKDSKTDSLLNQLQSATTQADQKKIVDQLQETVYNQVPVVTLFYGGLWGLFSDKTFTGWPSESNPYASPATWTQNVLLVVTNLKKA
jgi:peptide/nickel transport system substrate-binding protein